MALAEEIGPAMPLRALSLYSGIGGLDLAAEAAGFRTVAFVECDDYCQRVLAHHWKDVPLYERDTEVTAERLRRDGLICGCTGRATGEEAVYPVEQPTAQQRPEWLVDTAPQRAAASSSKHVPVADAERERRDGLPFAAPRHDANGHDARWRQAICRTEQRGQAGHGAGVQGQGPQGGAGCPGPIDLVHGGPPCQPASAAGKRGGRSDERWRWPQALRIIGEIRPRWAVLEQPPGILSLRHGDGEPAFGRILLELAALGYRVGYGTWAAADVGAPHRRERVFIVARRTGPGVGLADAERAQRRPAASAGDGGANGHDARGDQAAGGPAALRAAGGDGGVGQAHAPRHRRQQGRPQPASHAGRSDAARCGGASGAGAVGDSEEQPFGAGRRPSPAAGLGRGRSGHADGARGGVGQADASGELPGCLDDGTVAHLRDPGTGAQAGGASLPGSHERTVESVVGRGPDGRSRRLAGHSWPARPGEAQHEDEAPRLATGVPERVAQLRALGNAVVPQQALPLFEAIMEQEREEAQRG